MFNKIKNNFDKAAFSYDQYAHIQKNAASTLVAWLKDISPKSILDIGSGTGFVIESLIEMFPNSLYTLNDIAPKMLKQAKEKFKNASNIHYLVADAEKENFQEHDLIISNLAFQWFNNLPATLKSLWEKTACLAFSTLVQGTFLELSKAYLQLKIPCRVDLYPDSSNLKNICLNLSPKQVFFDIQTKTLFFDKAIDFLRYLKKIGANTSLQDNSAAFLQKILNQFPNGIQVEYKIFYAVLLKSIK